MNNIDPFIIKTIYDSVITIPGVVALANYTSNSSDDLITNDISKAIEIEMKDDIYQFKIHVVLLNGVNILDVMTEIQIRIKYELEKNVKNFLNHTVTVAVDDLML
ncbi:Asp23/Gls24 family envelope stress response protein [Mycoplasma yeatsii]|uniref:Asp23/Gls24 family envelope stress response protein n=1 Tax=Mycoplasma yeatsii TaxID=51365 RepID=UPI0005B23F7F|nr:Asp23/Gls24 family envelope stress response protein [Mycoplasma yeatsii]AJM72015.1 membrane protein [Mycoplasma yeatsii GM274B]